MKTLFTVILFLFTMTSATAQGLDLKKADNAANRQTMNIKDD